MKTLITILLLGIFISSQAQNISQSQVRQFNAVPAYRVFGRGAGVGTPSFITLDSNHVPLLHSQGYYDGRYGSLSVQNTNTTAIGTKLNIADTANIRLRPVAGTNMTITGSYPNLTFNATASGGGGSSGLTAVTAIDSATTHFSSFNSGISANTTGAVVGTVLNESFAGTSIPSGWVAAGSPSVTYNNKAIISGGASDYSQYLENGYFNYDKEKISITVVPQSKGATATDGIGITFGSNALNFSSSLRVGWNLSGSVDSGKITLNFDGAANVATSPNFSFNAGDTLIASLSREGWALVASLTNKRSGQRVETSFINSSHFGTGGKFRLAFLGGAQHVTNVNVTSWNLKNTGVAFVGDSHTAGAGSTAEANSYVQVLMKGNKYRYSNYGQPSITLDKWLVSDMPNLIAQKPAYAVFAMGYNDISLSSTDTASFGTRLRTFDDAMTANGITPIYATIVPRNVAGAVGGSTDIYSTSIINNATSRGRKIADVRTALLKGGTTIWRGYLSPDNVHMTDSGHLIMAQTIAQVAPELFDLYRQDTTSNIVFNNLPSGVNNMSLVGVNSKGEIFKIPNTLPTGSTWIQNRSAASSPQLNAGVYVAYPIRSDSAFIGGAVQGLRIGFNNFTNTNSFADNINITNAGVGSIGFPQMFDNMTGLNNIKIVSNPLKGNATQTVSGNTNILIQSPSTATLSGNNNTIIGSSFASSLTSGSGNIFMGTRAGASITTGSNNIHIFNNADINGANTAGLTGTIIIGNNALQNNFPAVNGDIIIGAYQSANNFWLGGKADGANFSINSIGGTAGTNQVGILTQFRGSTATGIAEPGKTVFQYSALGATGTTRQSTYNSTMQVERTGVAIGNTSSTFTKAPDAVLDVQSTTQGVTLPRMTTAQRDAMAGGVQSVTTATAGSGYTNAIVPIVFSGGGCTTQPTAYVSVSAAGAGVPTLTSRGAGCTSAPTGIVTSGAGTGATFTVTIGVTEGIEIYNLTTHQKNYWNGTAWTAY